MRDLLQDIRFGVRMLVRHPLVSAVAVITLALGMGVNGVIFSGTSALYLTAQPYANSERIVVLNSADRNNPVEIQTSFADFSDWKARSRSFAQLAAWSGWGVSLADGPRNLRLEGTLVSVDFFPLLGIPAEIGRTLSPGDHQRGNGHVVVISHLLWDSVFGKNPATLGRTILLNDEAFTIVGIMPPSFQFPPRQGLWAPLEPLASLRNMEDRNARNMAAIGTLRSGATLNEARTELAGIAAALERQHPETNNGITAAAVSLTEATVGKYRRSVLILQWAVGFVLLIACANLANLLLAQTAGRQREFGIRVAIGATRRRLIVQLLSESLVLSFVGAVVGAFFARWTLEYLQRQLADSLARLGQVVTIDFRVMVFMAAVAVLTAVVVGLTPALIASKPDLERFLREGGRGGSPRHRRLQGIFVVAEIALAMMLLVAAGLMIRTVGKLADADPGFRTDHVLTMRLALPESRYPDAVRTADFFRDIEPRIRALPGVESFAAVTYLPLIGYNGGTAFRIAGQAAEGRPYRSDIQPMTPDFFRVLRIPMLRGRPFSTDDWNAAPDVAIVNNVFVQRYFGGADALGKTLLLGDTPDTVRAVSIVGIVKDTYQFGMYSDPRPEIYVPTARRTMYLTIGTTVNPNSLAASVRREIEQVDPDQTVFAVSPMANVMSRYYGTRQSMGMLLTALGTIALVMVTIAIYGVIACSVTERSHEIGVRIALGADRKGVLGLVLRSGMRLALVGVAVGMLGAAAVSRAMQRMLYGVTVIDPVTYLGIGALICVVAFAACYFPARRAARVDPIVALRCE